MSFILQGSKTFRLEFTSADLVAGKLIATHRLKNEFNNVFVYDETKELVKPQVKVLSKDQIEIDLSDFSVFGTWNLIIKT